MWHLLVRLLHDHLHSLKGVVIETGSLARSIFLKDGSTCEPVITNSKHSKIVTLEYLTSRLCNGVDSDEVLSPPRIITTSNSLSLGVSTATISTSPYMAYDASHSCNDCTHLKQSSGQFSELISHLPLKDKSSVTIRWHVPLSQARHCTVSNDSGIKRLEMLNFPFFNRHREQKAAVRTPVFITSLGRELTGLLNLFHSGYQQLQVVVVTVESQFERYCKAWPQHIIMALPDHKAMGLGELASVCLSFRPCQKGCSS